MTQTSQSGPSSSDEQESSRDSPAISPIESSGSRLHGAAPGLGSRTSSTTSILKLNHLLPEEEDHGADTYGVRELRDSFFDAVFLKASRLPSRGDIEELKGTLPAAFDKHGPLAVKHFLPTHWHKLESVARLVFTTHAGVKLLKSFLAYFIAYVLCLVPVTRNWLGQQHYILVVSVILNHSSRTLGAQVDGAILTIFGTAFGIAWGAIALLLSTSTLVARAGYGGILALFLLLFIAAIAWVRAFFVRFYQALICAGIAIIYTALAETDSTTIPWPKLRDYAISFALGQAIALAVNVVIDPDAGARPLATSLHESFEVMKDALNIPHARQARLRRRLSKSFVDLSEAHRDMVIDTSISRFRPADVLELRNLMQAMLRALLSMDTETPLLRKQGAGASVEHTGEKGPESSVSGQNQHEKSVLGALSPPTKELVLCMREGILRCEAALMDIAGHRKATSVPKDNSSDIAALNIRFRQTISEFDTVESTLLQSDDLPGYVVHDSEIVELFVFARHVRETAATLQQLLDHVSHMQTVPSWPRIRLPSYAFSKAIYRTNAQIRHDRGGVVAGSYHVTFADIAQLLDKIKSRRHRPSGRPNGDAGGAQLNSMRSNLGRTATVTEEGKEKDIKVRYQIWQGLYKLQGFESKYAFKACLVTSLLSVPSYLDQSKWWWNRYEVWWAVAMSWIVMHPRVGGNLQDLFNRSGLAIFGAVWAGAGYAAGNGNPYVMAVFAAIYMIPMLYRHTLSSHPRSGLVGSLSFTVVSLTLMDHQEGILLARYTAYKGLVFFIGTAAPILVNWVLWPFVARHELRAALSSMLFFMSVTYRSAVGTYVYFEQGHVPTPEDIQRSELLEARLREGFVRIRQLLVLTRHEIRLRAPFDPVPFSALTEACERFAEHITALRQSALFYDTGYIRDSPRAAERLLPYRRDAAAAVLANLYILAGALRSHRKVPRYLPSAAAARKALLVQSDKLEEELITQAAQGGSSGGGSVLHEINTHRKWSDIYRFSYNQSLTGCIVQLEEMEKYTKLIVGEQG